MSAYSQATNPTELRLVALVHGDRVAAGVCEVALGDSAAHCEARHGYTRAELRLFNRALDLPTDLSAVLLREKATNTARYIAGMGPAWTELLLEGEP